ncbi:MAG: ABC transporter substrate-binding protein [Betaproteobacteria bacterium]|nr:ABC transporter substrate-binding protein [Betaproteobacteria bacterium]
MAALKPRRKLRELSLRDALTVGLPLVLVLVAGFWLAAQFIKPAPPDFLVFSSGGEGGAYQLYAARYQQILSGEGIELRERPSAGSIDNLQRLLDEDGDVDAAFVQGGTGADIATDRLVSLGSLYPEPLWIFYRGHRDLDHLGQLRGLRLAVGPEGSGTRKLALELLEANGIAAAPTRLLPLSGLEAVKALRQGRVDVLFVVGAAHSAAVWSAFYTPGVRLMSLANAEAYPRRFPYLSHLVLPQGAIDLERSIPQQDVHLVAPVATLVVREGLHPALIDLLLQAAQEAHGGHGLFQKQGEFPRATQVDFPLSPEAQRFYRSGKPFLQRYLPFWIATLLDRMLVMLIPLFAVLIPVLKFAPSLYGWRVRSRIYRWYGELKFLEDEMERDPRARPANEWMQRLENIERNASRIRTPLAFADQLYTLRQHIALVRRGMERRGDIQA